MFFNLEKQVKKYKIKTNELAYVGANLGQNINEFKSLFNNPVIHLFEPQKHVFNNLKKSYSNDNSLRFYNFALGSKTSNVEMHINTNNFNQSSSILKPTGTIDYHRGILFAGTETIEVKKFSDLKLNKVTFINIDVQGYELEVLKGCGNALKNIHYIMTEVNRKEMYKDCPLVKDLDKFLKDFNFIRVKTVWWDKTIPWGDALYVKSSKVTLYNKLNSFFWNKLQSFKGYFFLLSIPKKIKNKLTY